MNGADFINKKIVISDMKLDGATVVFSIGLLGVLLIAGCTQSQPSEEESNKKIYPLEYFFGKEELNVRQDHFVRTGGNDIVEMTGTVFYKGDEPVKNVFVASWGWNFKEEHRNLSSNWKRILGDKIFIKRDFIEILKPGKSYRYNVSFKLSNPKVKKIDKEEGADVFVRMTKEKCLENKKLLYEEREGTTPEDTELLRMKVLCGYEKAISKALNKSDRT
jgi:hypothetical protein